MTFYSNPEYDKLVEQQANTDDPDQRLDLIRQALDIEAETCQDQPVLYGVQYCLQQGFKLQGMPCHGKLQLV